MSTWALTLHWLSQYLPKWCEPALSGAAVSPTSWTSSSSYVGSQSSNENAIISSEISNKSTLHSTFDNGQYQSHSGRANYSYAKNSQSQDGREHRFTYSTTTLLIRYFGRRFSIPNYDFLQKAISIFSVQVQQYWKIIIVVKRSAIGPWGFQGHGLPEAGSGAILGPAVFPVLYFGNDTTESYTIYLTNI